MHLVAVLECGVCLASNSALHASLECGVCLVSGLAYILLQSMVDPVVVQQHK